MTQQNLNQQQSKEKTLSNTETLSKGKSLNKRLSPIKNTVYLILIAIGFMIWFSMKQSEQMEVRSEQIKVETVNMIDSVFSERIKQLDSTLNANQKVISREFSKTQRKIENINK